MPGRRSVGVGDDFRVTLLGIFGAHRVARPEFRHQILDLAVVDTRVNEILDELIDTHHFARERTRELLGHTWGEVFAGLALGLLLAYLFYR